MLQRLQQHQLYFMTWKLVVLQKLLHLFLFSCALPLFVFVLAHPLDVLCRELLFATLHHPAHLAPSTRRFESNGATTDAPLNICETVSCLIIFSAQYSRNCSPSGPPSPLLIYSLIIGKPSTHSSSRRCHCPLVSRFVPRTYGSPERDPERSPQKRKKRNGVSPS